MIWSKEKTQEDCFIGISLCHAVCSLSSSHKTRIALGDDLTNSYTAISRKIVGKKHTSARDNPKKQPGA